MIRSERQRSISGMGGLTTIYRCTEQLAPTMVAEKLCSIVDGVRI